MTDMYEEDEDMVLVVVPMSYVLLLESIVALDPDWASSDEWEFIDDVRSVLVEDSHTLHDMGVLPQPWNPDMDSDQPRDYTMIPPRPEIARYSLADLAGDPDDE